MLIRNNTSAPSFSLPDSEGATHSLDELWGDGALVLHFFRGAFCPTAHRDLLTYGDTLERVRALDADLVAVSADDSETLADLKERLKIPFMLLGDGDFSVSQTYGIYTSDETEAGPQPHGEPAVFVIDKAGPHHLLANSERPQGHGSGGRRFADAPIHARKRRSLLGRRLARPEVCAFFVVLSAVRRLSVVERDEVEESIA